MHKCGIVSDGLTIIKHDTHVFMASKEKGPHKGMFPMLDLDNNCVALNPSCRISEDSYEFVSPRRYSTTTGVTESKLISINLFCVGILFLKLKNCTV